MNIRERIILFCKTVGITKTEFERRAGLCNGYTNSVRRGVGSKLPQILEAFPQLNKDWLLFEDGPMFKSDIETVEGNNEDSAEKAAIVLVDDHCSIESPDELRLVDDGLTVGERMDIFIKSKGLGRYQFEMKCGLSQGYIANIRNSPHPDKIKKIVNVYPELNVEWLVIGRGKMVHSKGGSVIKIIGEFMKEMQQERVKRAALEDMITGVAEKVNNLIKK